jgi:hypothetical protein
MTSLTCPSPPHDDPAALRPCARSTRACSALLQHQYLRIIVCALSSWALQSQSPQSRPPEQMTNEPKRGQMLSCPCSQRGIFVSVEKDAGRRGKEKRADGFEIGG